MVLIATIYILFPHENRDRLESALQCVTWGLARLDAMKTMNKMAKVAHDVVRELDVKMQERTLTEMWNGASGHTSSGAASVVIPEDLLALHPPQPLHDLILLESANLFADGNVESSIELPSQDMLGDDFWKLVDLVYQ